MPAILAALLLLLSGPAFAHAILVDSQPAAGSTIDAGQIKITLRYNSRIDQARSRLTLRGTDAEMTLPPAPAPADQLASTATLSPGQYLIHWQVLAVDGHITRGDVRFTVQQR